MLVLFRSKSPGQHWVTALGLVADAALHLHMVRGLERGPQYWMLRRAIMLFDVVTEGTDISSYRAVPESNQQEGSDLFLDLHTSMTAHGFDVLPVDEARVRGQGASDQIRAPTRILDRTSCWPRAGSGVMPSGTGSATRSRWPTSAMPEWPSTAPASSPPPRGPVLQHDVLGGHPLDVIDPHSVCLGPADHCRLGVPAGSCLSGGAATGPTGAPRAAPEGSTPPNSCSR